MARIEQAVVLAAGRGTRMKELTDKTPKPLLPVAGVPLIERVMRPLMEGGVKRFVIVTGYLAEKIEEHLAKLPNNIEVIFVRQVDLNGTGGALRIAAPHLARAPFALTFGDVLTAAENYTGMLGDFNSRHSDLLMSVWDIGDPCRGAAITIGEDDRIEKMVEKPPPGTAGTPWINAGVVMSGPKLLDYLGGIGKSARGEVELPDAYSAWIRDGGVLRAFRLAEFWSDVGTPEDLQEMDARLSR